MIDGLIDRLLNELLVGYLIADRLVMCVGWLSVGWLDD
jgi:hypothetical protein